MALIQFRMFMIIMTLDIQLLEVLSSNSATYEQIFLHYSHPPANVTSKIESSLET